MLKQEPKFSFKNLQPVAYLKNFNKMVEYNTKHPLKSSPRHELKTVSLNKFPLPHYYQDMEGIFESVNKKIDSNSLKKDIEDVKEEEFMKKHNQFMRKVLTRFIQHNQNRQGLYEKEKEFIRYKDQAKHHLRALSEPKLLKKKMQKEPSINPEGSPSLLTLATKGSSIKNDEEGPKQEGTNVFPKLKPRRKRQKMTFRDQKKVHEYIVNRKLTAPVVVCRPPSKKVSQAEDTDFKNEIMGLEVQQVNKQSCFAQKIEKQILQFDKKMDIQVHSIKYYNFWKEPGKEEMHKNSYRGRESRPIEERLDYEIPFQDYQTR